MFHNFWPPFPFAEHMLRTADSAALARLHDGSDCCICLEAFKDRVMAPCGHAFCSACITAVLRSAAEKAGPCPLCRAPLQLTALRTARHGALLVAEMGRQRALDPVPDAQYGPWAPPGAPAVLFVDVHTDLPGPLHLRDNGVLTEAVMWQSLVGGCQAFARGRVPGGRWMAAFHVKATGACLPPGVVLELSFAVDGRTAATRTVDVRRALPPHEWRHLVVGVAEVPPGGAECDARLTSSSAAFEDPWYSSLLLDCLVLTPTSADALPDPVAGSLRDTAPGVPDGVPAAEMRGVAGAARQCLDDGLGDGFAAGLWMP